MAAKKTSELVPLCHPILITHVGVELSVSGGENQQQDRATKGEVTSMPWQGTGQGDAYPWHKEDFGRVGIEATVSCDGKTGVEMEALTAASTAALTVYDMCKAVDRGMRVMDLRVVEKEGGRSGKWVEGESVDEDSRR